jgi:coproporphyrinogen dehydrogenase HemZ
VERIVLVTDCPEIWNDLCDVVRLFRGECEIAREGEGETRITHEIREGAHVACAYGCEARVPLAPDAPDELERRRRLKRGAKNALYQALKAATGRKPPWGSLTGIRPTRLLAEQRAAGKTEEEAVRALIEGFDVSPDKALLLRDIAREQSCVPAPAPGEIDVYVGIPFCRTRCSYCSFAALDLAHGAKLTGAYVEAVTREMRLVAGDLSAFRVRGLYVGGGTPTALSTEELARVLDCALQCFPGWREFTVEAGRPDTLSEDKLRLLQDAGATRVSLNPQTMNDETLRRVGRDHTAADIERVYGRMREMGFSDINMDLILALPGETIQDVARTLERVARLAPENLTVHTLALKRAAALRFTDYVADEQAAERMVHTAADAARAMGLAPYYLYRQKYMAGNLENVGYCRPGMASLYNIDIMEEIAPIAAFGAGAISKWLYPAARRIERAPNVKNVEQYIARVDEMAERKRALWSSPGRQEENA